MSRGKSEKTLAFAMSSVAATLAKFSMDVCLYMSQNLISLVCSFNHRFEHHATQKKIQMYLS
jgi:hypothetical protein